ncbi:MAG: hypothetical protein Q7S13_01005 [Candidatus Omnitrophota bacterium]|nr:hypothetical protein [Candidatus Omnitrophota bacterium]
MEEVKEQDIVNIMSLFDIPKKKELIKFAKEIIIQKGAFASVIFAAEDQLLPYLHQISYRDYVPQHLKPTDAEREALSRNGVGEIKGDALKFVSKVSQIFEDRKYLVGHLFYSPDLSKWHFFYFSQRDWDNRDNHWEQGSHIHFINYLWNLDVKKLWGEFINEGKIPGGALHIRFQEDQKGDNDRR